MLTNRGVTIVCTYPRPIKSFWLSNCTAPYEAVSSWFYGRLGKKNWSILICQQMIKSLEQRSDRKMSIARG
jgi:hypothetical protein